MTRTTSTGGGVRPVKGRPDLWQARYVGADGRRHSLYGRTQREAQAKLRAALQLADNGVAPVGQQLTVGAYLEAWLAGTVAMRCRPRTAESYRETVERYIAPALGRVPLAKLEPEQVSRMLAALTARGTLSPSTVRYAYAVLRIALGRALKEGKVLRNVCTLVDPPARPARELRPLTAPEVRHLLATAAGDRSEALYVAAVGLGLRQGELLALRWEDVDLEAGTLTVRHTLQRGARVLAEPKTERSRRTLALPAAVRASMREHRLRQLEARLATGNRWHDEGYVFTGSTGRPRDAREVTREYQRVLARAGLPASPSTVCATRLRRSCSRQARS